MQKEWYKSKVLWIGVITTLIGALSLLATLLQQASITPSDVVLFSVGVLNIVLRVWFTDTKLVG